PRRGEAVRSIRGWLTAISLAAAAVAAGQTPPSFRFEREVAPGGRGGNRLAVDAPLLTGAAPLRYGAAGKDLGYEGGLEDLRFLGVDGREVGYLVMPPRRAAPVWQAGRMLSIAPTKTQSGFEVDLGGALRTDRLRLEGIPAPYLKRVRLEGGGDRARWTLLVSGGTLFGLPDQK